MDLPPLYPRCEELEDLVAALKGTAGFYWALWQEVQHVLAHLPAPRRHGSPYARWYDGPRAFLDVIASDLIPLDRLDRSPVYEDDQAPDDVGGLPF